MTFKDRLSALGFSSYGDYLKSGHWLLFKEKIKGRKRRCPVCGSDKNLEIHHKTYERLGCENKGDVVCLCPAHHDDVHAWLKEENQSVEATDRAIASIRAKAKRAERVALPRKPQRPPKPKRTPIPAHAIDVTTDGKKHARDGILADYRGSEKMSPHLAVKNFMAQFSHATRMNDAATRPLSKAEARKLRNKFRKLVHEATE